MVRRAKKGRAKMYDYTIFASGREVENLSPEWYATEAEAKRAGEDAADDCCPRGSTSRDNYRVDVGEVESNGVRVLGSICHGDDDPDATDHRRITIGLRSDGVIVEADEDELDWVVVKGMDVFTSSEEAREACVSAWSGYEWDWQSSQS
jgi:hypothetical protein